MSCFIWNMNYSSVSQKLHLRSCRRKSPRNRPSWTRFLVRWVTHLQEVGLFIGSITSRCSGKSARTHPPKGAAGRVRFPLLVSANHVTACRFSSGKDCRINYHIKTELSKWRTMSRRWIRKNYFESLLGEHGSAWCNFAPNKQENWSPVSLPVTLETHEALQNK